MMRFFGHVGVTVASFILTFALYIFTDIVTDAIAKPAKLRTAFSEFVHEVEMGRVEEIRVNGRRYTYGVRGSREHETLGPAMTEAEIATLRPTDATLPAPKVIYIKHP